MLQYAIQLLILMVKVRKGVAVVKTASVNVRIQENVKAKAEEILDRQIIMHNGIPFPVTIPSELPARDALDERRFNALMSAGYSQALSGDSYGIDEVFDDLGKNL